MIRSACALCQSPLATQSYCAPDSEEEHFCCTGCQVVYQILKTQNALEQFHEHPVFRQALQAGLITNPHLHFSKQEEAQIPEEDFHKLHLTIQEMWCPSCAQVIHLILMQEKGIRHCVVDYSTDLACIDYTPRLISKDKIIRRIREIGYQPQSLQDPRQQAISRSLLLRFIVAAFFALNVMMFAYPIYATYFDGDTEGYAMLFAWLSLAGSLPVLCYSAWPIWRRCWTAWQVGIWGMETLVCLGVAAATGLSLYELWQGSPYVYFDSMTVIIAFVLLGKMIELRAKFSAKDALVKLSLALPRRGRKRLESGEEQFVAMKDIQSGDCLIVRMGEKIVLDGIVEAGTGACDESLMTGESLPVPKQPGALVLAGSLLQQGYLEVRVTARLEETALHRIIDMVGQDVEHKTRYVRAVDQIVKWFVPLVLCLAVATAFVCIVGEITDNGKTVWQTALIRAVSVLLISCPCAIGIAVPLVESHLLNCLAKVGVIVRNRGCLSFLGKETAVVLDKTGTVTEGQFKVCQGLEKLSFDEQRLLKGLVARSLHPIALAIDAALLCPPLAFQQIEEIVGRGLKGRWQSREYYLGSADFLKQQGISVELKMGQLAIETVVYFANHAGCLTALVLGDQLKTGVQEFVRSLPASTRTFLVSGDAENTVAKVAQLCGVHAWKAGYHPLQKRAFIEELKEKEEVVIMMGDGINDAPALTAAHVGVAVISATDISIQVSDLLLTTPRFEVLTQMRQMAVKAQRVMKQNLFWAFFYNVVGLGLAVAGWLTPLFAAFAMVMSSLFVLFNAQRIGVNLREKN